MDFLGLLRICVRRGINLAVRDTMSISDPYVVISCGSQKVKTKSVKDNCSPDWNEELTLYIRDLNAPINLRVFDKDTLTTDDKMGKAQIDIKPLTESVKMGLLENNKSSSPAEDGSEVVKRVQQTEENCLSEESAIVWKNGKMSQEMILRLKDVECGEVEIEIEWIHLPSGKGPMDDL